MGKFWKDHPLLSRGRSGLTYLLVFALAWVLGSCRGGALVNPNCPVNPETLDFGRVAVGATVFRTLTISNPGPDSIVGYIRSNCSDYYLRDGAYSLAAGQTATVTVEFDARTVGEEDCAITTGLTGCRQILARAVVQAAPRCAFSPPTLDFGIVGIGQEASRLVTVSNPGDVPIQFYPYRDYCGGFYVEGNPGSVTLAPGQATQLSIRFRPSFAGDQSCSFPLQSPGNFGAVCGPLLVHGVGSGCLLSATYYNFGAVPVGETRYASLTILNRGASTLSGRVGVACLDFTLLQTDGTPWNGNYSVRSNDRMDFVVRWTPTVLDSASCLVTVGGPECGTVALKGKAISGLSPALRATR